MAFTPSDAKHNMESLIKGLESQRQQLKDMIDGLVNTTKIAELNNLREKLNIEIKHRKSMAAFEEASVEIIRPPTPQEVAALQATLRALDKDLSGLANFQAVVSFVEDVMTQNAERFVEIVETIKKKANA
ncbi:MAG: hypothetical protein JOZ96_09625 [Acidobacteria bacterium]|nr:hypothetical protein [Acidobacteriota bacterium]